MCESTWILEPWYPSDGASIMGCMRSDITEGEATPPTGRSSPDRLMSLMLLLEELLMSTLTGTASPW